MSRSPDFWGKPPFWEMGPVPQPLWDTGAISEALAVISHIRAGRCGFESYSIKSATRRSSRALTAWKQNVLTLSQSKCTHSWNRGGQGRKQRLTAALTR